MKSIGPFTRNGGAAVWATPGWTGGAWRWSAAWQWREAEAQRRNCPVRRVLRDDLIIELAKRQTADVKRIQAVRGLERGDLSRQNPQDGRLHPAGLEPSRGRVPSAGPSRSLAAAFGAGPVPLLRLGKPLPAGEVGPRPGRHAQRHPRPDRPPHGARPAGLAPAVGLRLAGGDCRAALRRSVGRAEVAASPTQLPIRPWSSSPSSPVPSRLVPPRRNRA